MTVCLVVNILKCSLFLRLGSDWFYKLEALKCVRLLRMARSYITWCHLLAMDGIAVFQERRQRLLPGDLTRSQSNLDHFEDKCPEPGIARIKLYVGCSGKTVHHSSSSP